MDVVRPSSDTRAKSAPATSQPVSRQAPIISPLQDVASTQLDDAVDEPQPSVNQVVVPRSSDDRDLATTLSETASRETKPPIPMEDIAELVTEPAKEPATVPEVRDLSSNESLFISDAKVEKRPLSVQPLLGTKLDQAEVSSPPLEPAQAAIKTQLPDELSGRIMAIESEKETTTRKGRGPNDHDRPDRRYAHATA